MRNVYLRQKQDYLDNECKTLAEHILVSQISAAGTTETAEVVEKKLQKIREDCEQKLSELQRAHEKVFTLSVILEDHVSILSYLIISYLVNKMATNFNRSIFLLNKQLKFLV